MIKTIQFENLTDSAGIEWNGERGTYSTNWVDFNGDELLDLSIAPHATSTNNPYLAPKLYINQGDGTFVDIHAEVISTAGDHHGTIWTDFDNDGDQDLFITTGGGNGVKGGPSKLFVNQNGILEDRAAQLGIQIPLSRGRAALWVDVDNDGLLDLIHVNDQRPDRQFPTSVYRQTATGFENINQQVGFDVPKATASAQIADLFGDGKLDLILLSDAQSPLRVYDISSPVWQDITHRFPQIAHVRDVAITDINGDLVPDLFFVGAAEYRSEFVNDNVFQSDNILVARLLAEPVMGNPLKGVEWKSTGSITIDSLNLLESLNILNSFENAWSSIGGLSNIFIGSNRINPTTNRFTLSPDNPAVIGIPSLTAGSPLGLYIGYDAINQVWQVINYNLNNRQSLTIIIETENSLSDLTTLGFNQPNLRRLGGIDSTLLVYDPTTGEYVDQTVAAGLNQPLLSQSLASGDFDNDGDIDFYATSVIRFYALPSTFFENQGDGTFVTINNAAGAQINATGPRSEEFNVGLNAGVADYDLDGFLDIFVANNGHRTGNGSRTYPFKTYNGVSHHLFHNVGNNNNSIQIDLHGVISNRDAVGTKVFVTSNGNTQLREQSGGAHHLAQNQQRLHFGLADSTTIEVVRVEWTSGVIQEIYNIGVNQVIDITENQGTNDKDLIQGSNQGFANNDFIDGNNGWDTLIGGLGDDILRGGQGNDLLIGDINSFVDPEALVLHLEFEEISGSIADDLSPNNNNGALRNGVFFEQGTVRFDGFNDSIRIANTEDINWATHPKRTISLQFNADDVNRDRKQLLYKEGGAFHGLSIYIEESRLYVGIWKRNSWQTFLSTDAISSNRWHTVSLVLDAQAGNNTPQADVLTAYLDGVAFGQGQSAQLTPHSSPISLGGLLGSSQYHDETVDGVATQTRNDGFAGRIDSVRLYNRALNSQEIEAITHLSGGVITGKDLFVYDLNTVFDSSLVGIDTLQDFIPGIDKFQLRLSTFSALRSEAGEGFSRSREFTIVDSNALAAQSDSLIVYNSRTGGLFYNQNGADVGLGQGAQFAQLSGIPALSGNDFLLVA